MSRLRALLALTLVLLLGSAAVAVAANIEGTDGPDALVGTPANDRIDARGGDDTVFGLGGSDRIRGGWGDDDIDGDGQCPPGATDPDYCQHGDNDHCDDHGHGHGHGHGHSSKGRHHGDDCDDHGHHGGCPPGTKDPTYCENVDGNDKIRAGSGDDSVRGGGGDDWIRGGLGWDDISAGSGDDHVDVFDGEYDTVDCGSGRDMVHADRFDTVARDCEKVTRPKR
jgi:Ca2+-binding RTX toxin-like protein